MNKEYVILDSLKKFEEALADTEVGEITAFDLETNSGDEHRAKTIGIGWTQYVDEGYYLPIMEYIVEDDVIVYTGFIKDRKHELQIVNRLLNVLEKCDLIMHNGLYDVIVTILDYTRDLTEAFYADTMLLKHTVDEDRPLGLKDIAVLRHKEIGIPDDELANQEQEELKLSVKENGGKWTKKQKDIYKGDRDIIGYYCCADVDLTMKLFEYYEDILFDEKLDDLFYEREVMPLCKKASIPMNLKGLCIDIEYFTNLKKEVECGIINLRNEVFDYLGDALEERIEFKLDKDVKASPKGKFAERLLQHYSLPVPRNAKTGKPTFAKKALQQLEASYPSHPAIRWLLGEESIEQDVLYVIKKSIYVEKKPKEPEVFNLKSKPDLKWLMFEHLGLEPKKVSRKTKEPSVDADSLETYKEDHPFVELLLKLFKEEKLLSTYISPILEKHIDGWIYPSMFQCGTTSGRYSCIGGLNLQTLPRDDLRIKKGFIPPPGYAFVAADFASLEARCFAEKSGDWGLIGIYKNNLDLYSQIAIDVLGIEDVSADPKSPRYLKKVSPADRNVAKVFTLAVPYGSGAWQVGKSLNMDFKEAQQLIDNYLQSYPELKKYMTRMETEAIRRGYVKTGYGRVRHLHDAKKLYRKFGKKIFNKKVMEGALGEEGITLYYRFKNLLNNAKNSPIQGTAAHITNQAMIKLSDTMIENNIDGWPCLQIHDEIITIVKIEQVPEQIKLLQDAMENNIITDQMEVAMEAEPQVAYSLAEAK